MSTKFFWICVANILLSNELKLVESNDCRNVSMTTDFYKGRYFENRAIDSGYFMMQIKVDNAFACRHMCIITLHCKAITYMRAARSENCKLYSIFGLNELIVIDKDKDTIFIPPIDYRFSDSNFTRAFSDDITVEAKDDKPGEFYFELPTGMYKIKLNYITGGLGCSVESPILLPFGCQGPRTWASTITLVKEFRGDVVVNRRGFSLYEGDGTVTQFISTADYVEMVNGAHYTIWYLEDYQDTSEYDNNGATTFTLLAELLNSINT